MRLSLLVLVVFFGATLDSVRGQSVSDIFSISLVESLEENTKSLCRVHINGQMLEVDGKISFDCDNGRAVQAAIKAFQKENPSVRNMEINFVFQSGSPLAESRGKNRTTKVALAEIEMWLTKVTTTHVNGEFDWIAMYSTTQP